MTKTLEQPTEAPPAPLAWQFSDLQVAPGQIVWWWKDGVRGKGQPPTVAIIVKVDFRSVDVALVKPSIASLDSRIGVKCIHDPTITEGEKRSNGAFCLPDAVAAARERMAGLERRVAELEAVVKAKRFGKQTEPESKPE